MNNLLLLAEIALPVTLIILLGFLAWRLVQGKWVNKFFVSFVYKRSPFVSDFYEQVGRSIEEKGNRFVRPVSYIALILCVALIFRILWPHLIDQRHPASSFLEDELPLIFLHMGLIFVGLGISASVISSLFFIKETGKFNVYHRSVEIYLLSKYLENILNFALGISVIVATAYLWFFLLDLLVPVFRYLENQSVSYRGPKSNFEEMLRLWKVLIIGFKDQFQTWCILSFLISIASLMIPYLWFKGKRFTKIFLALFLSGTIFSYVVSFLIRTFLHHGLNWILLAVWIFSALITSMVFHLVNTIWLNKITICGRCQTENSIRSNYCSECGRKLILLPKEDKARV